MHLVAVSRVMNEEDIVEAFVRHHAPLVDHHVVLDNGSGDRTLEILLALKAEGVPLTILQNRSPVFAELLHNTILYNAAVAEHGADWVLFLDADEFVDERDDGELRHFLEAAPHGAPSVGIEMINYLAPAPGTAERLNVAERLIRRIAKPIDVWKVFVRGFTAGRVTVSAGNHYIYLDGAFSPPVRRDGLLLAHFPNRGPAHWAGKAVAGWAKVLAGGQQEVAHGWSAHYRPVFDSIKERPRAFLDETERMLTAWQTAPGLVDDPIRYGGRDLLYTEAVDHAWRALRLLMLQYERLAKAHGALLDRDTAVRDRAEADAAAIDVLAGSQRIAAQSGYGSVLSTAWRHARDAGFPALLGAGWSEPETWGGVWGLGTRHEMRLIYLVVLQDGLAVEAEVEAPLLRPGETRRVAVSASGTQLAVWEFTPERNRGLRSVRIPADLAMRHRPALTLTFAPDVVVVPAESDPGSTDRRAIGIGLRRIRSGSEIVPVS